VLAMFEQPERGTRVNAHVSGVTLEYDPARPAGQRIVRALDAKGQPIDPDRIYTVILLNFLVEDEYAFVQRAAVSTEYLPLRDNDMLAGYLRRLPQPIRADTTTRIRAITPGGF
jgi:hypothetical protein